MYICMSYPEGTVGHIDFPPGDDDSVFNGLGRSVHTVKCAVSPVSDLDVDGAAFCILSRYSIISAWVAQSHVI